MSGFLYLQGDFVCSDSCEENEHIYNKSENEVYCLSSFSYDGEELYQDKSELICYKSCSEANNGNNKLYENKCMSECPKDYISNENNIYTKEIKDSIIFNKEYSLSPNPNQFEINNMNYYDFLNNTKKLFQNCNVFINNNTNFNNLLDNVLLSVNFIDEDYSITIHGNDYTILQITNIKYEFSIFVKILESLLSSDFFFGIIYLCTTTNFKVLYKISSA